MRTIVGSFGRDCVLIILFPLYGSKAGFFECNCSGWAGSMNPKPLYWKKN